MAKAATQKKSVRSKCKLASLPLIHKSAKRSRTSDEAQPPLFPDDIVQHILSFMHHKSLVKCMLVCKAWYRVANRRALVSKLFFDF